MGELELDFSLLPEELQHLAPFLATFAEGDDVKRAALVANASTDELRAMSTATDPHWDAINAYLDDNMEPPGPKQDLAVALSDFSQAAMEAGFELQDREAG